MLQLHAVRSILFDDIAGVRPDSDRPDDPIGTLQRAGRRALMVAVFDWLAILVLFTLRDGSTGFLSASATEQGLFTLGVLAVATHAGFRLAQREKYAAVARALEQLPAEGAGGDPPGTDEDR